MNPKPNQFAAVSPPGTDLRTPSKLEAIARGLHELFSSGAGKLTDLRRRALERDIQADLEYGRK